MRLIDADALKEEVNKKKVVGRFNTLLLIDNAPTVNTVSIEKQYFIKGFKKGYEYGKKLAERPHIIDNCDMNVFEPEKYMEGGAE